MALVKITQPADIISKVKDGGTMRLKWSRNFASKWNNNYSEAQKWLDSEVLRLCDPLTPKQTGALIQSGKEGTTIGSGQVRWISVYAAYQYYTTSLDHSTSRNPNGGAEWFERMKASNLSSLMDGVAKFLK